MSLSLIPEVVELGVGTLGVIRHEGGADTNGVNVLMKELLQRALTAAA